MNRAIFLTLLIATAGCSGGGGIATSGANGPSGNIVLQLPSGKLLTTTLSRPYTTDNVDLAISEPGYFGKFTTKMVYANMTTSPAQCFLLQPEGPNLINVQASLAVGCLNPQIVNGFQFSDALGHSATEYFQPLIASGHVQTATI